MLCDSCAAQVAADDNYCRKCGVALNVVTVPAVAPANRAVTVWEGARPAVTRGVALVAAGALLRYAVAWAGRAAFSRAAVNTHESLDPRRILPFVGTSASGANGRRGAEELEILWYRRVRH